MTLSDIKPKNNYEGGNKAEKQKNSELPIQKFKQEILEKLGKNDNLILSAETGAGKSTEFPLWLLDELGDNLDGKIAVTHPRKFATNSVAQRVADVGGYKLGQEVGSQTRFDKKTNQNTKLEFQTDGILRKKIEHDPLLLDYSIVMVDEAHERSLNIDILLGMLKRAQKLRKEQGLPDLKIVIASATIDEDKFIKYFSDGKDYQDQIKELDKETKTDSIKIPGRMFPVVAEYAEQDPERVGESVIKSVSNKILEVTKKHSEGDILVFVPGKTEIDTVINNLNELKNEFEILPLHAQLTPDEQNRVYKENGKRKIIISTNIAQTSVTLPDVRIVVDSGLIKQLRYNPHTGVNELLTEKCSKSDCEQRKGRAGRVAEGFYYRVTSDEGRREFGQPEIARSNLESVILSMKKSGVDPTDFDFIEKPPEDQLMTALKNLKELGALDDGGELTELGGKMVDIPLKPELAKMIIFAERYGVTKEVAAIAAFLDLKPVFRHSTDLNKRKKIQDLISEFSDKNSDFLTIFNVLTAFEEKKQKLCLIMVGGGILIKN